MCILTTKAHLEHSSFQIFMYLLNYELNMKASFSIFGVLIWLESLQIHNWTLPQFESYIQVMSFNFSVGTNFLDDSLDLEAEKVNVETHTRKWIYYNVDFTFHCYVQWLIKDNPIVSHLEHSDQELKVKSISLPKHASNIEIWVSDS